MSALTSKSFKFCTLTSWKVAIARFFNHDDDGDDNANNDDGERPARPTEAALPIDSVPSPSASLAHPAPGEIARSLAESTRKEQEDMVKAYEKGFTRELIHTISSTSSGVSSILKLYHPYGRSAPYP